MGDDDGEGGEHCLEVVVCAALCVFVVVGQCVWVDGSGLVKVKYCGRSTVL